MGDTLRRKSKPGNHERYDDREKDFFTRLREELRPTHVCNSLLELPLGKLTGYAEQGLQKGHNQPQNQRLDSEEQVRETKIIDCGLKAD